MERRKRLRLTGDIRQVYAHGRSWTHPLVTLIARSNGLHLTRFGFTASRTVGNAVARNRARRLMRESVRRLYPRVEPGWDVMLVARARMVGVKERVVREALATLLTRSGLLKDHNCRVEERRSA